MLLYATSEFLVYDAHGMHTHMVCPEPPVHKANILQM